MRILIMVLTILLNIFFYIPQSHLEQSSETVGVEIKTYLPIVLNNEEVPLDITEIIKTNFLIDPMNQSIVGFYLPSGLVLHVVQQPGDNLSWISAMPDEITQFGITGQIGLLAHNNLAGKYFSEIGVETSIYLIMGNGEYDVFQVSEILYYQALSPNSVYSDFLDLNTGQIIKNKDMFYQVYSGKNPLTLQTCIEKEGDMSWGRLFILANHKKQEK